MIFFQLLILLDLSRIIEDRFTILTFYEDNPPKLNLFKILKQNLTCLIIVCFCLLNLYELYLSYSLISIIFCPFKTWLLIFFIYLRIKCQNFRLNEFNKIIEMPNLNSQINKASHLRSFDSDDNIKLN